MPDRRWPALAVGSAITLGMVLAGCSADGPTNEGGFVSGRTSVTVVPAAERQPVPEASGVRLGGDGTVSTRQYAGKVVVLNVWGSWCGPCRKEAPELQEASVETKGDAQFVGLNTKDNNPAPAEAFVRAFGVTYPSIYDPKGEVLLRYAGQLPPNGIPSTLVLDADGRLAARVVGPISKTSLVDLITDVAGER